MAARRSPKGSGASRLEAPNGDRKAGKASGSTMQLRICFRWGDGDALDVEIVDYH
ncbi:Plasmid maintenance system killer [Dokdonella koreensis DS-123]|uniref:Plasmid maintenance system killer n=1 Tax=Dokdonella koreensis DS-123 TaxID=1300342 RepID=A0A160DSH5_9GAMM|nr:Plasmid maintenance system killer [Dokdonella koreensis DS-123]